jgi:hypothetical protein
MASVSKQQKRAKRAKTKAKEQRVARQHPQTPDPIVPDYFMPDFFSEDDAELLDDDTLLKNFVEPDILETMDEEEREAMAAVIRGEDIGVSLTEDEMLLMEVYHSPAPEPSQEQRLAHYEVLKLAEQKVPGFARCLCQRSDSRTCLLRLRFRRLPRRSGEHAGRLHDVGPRIG